MDEKVTDWISKTERPAIIGYYERDYDDDEATKIADFWSGQGWVVVDSEGNHIGQSFLALPWRGLASDPKASKP
jgi:hypothetical protein